MSHKLLSYWHRWGIFLILLLPIMVLFVVNPVFRQPGNLFNLWQQASIIGVLAVGQTLVLILGGFDLSVGTVAALAGVICYLVFAGGDGGSVVLLGVLAALAACAIVGAINGILITKFNITPLIATLGMLSLVRGFVLIVTEGQLVYAEGPGYTFAEFLQGSLFGMPVAGLLFALLAVAVALLLRRSIFGQYVFAIGGNEKAALLAGLPVVKVKILSYALCSVLAGVGGLLLSSRTASALPNAGVNYELQAITAAVIGGAALGGGKGSIFGTVLGVLLLTAIGNGLNLYNVSPFWQTGVTGLILLLAVGFSTWGNRDARSIVR
ncbi:MAG: ABC transporter permease [Mesorhizobium sp.]|nr:ABC transporter permease [Mesorhizobium sp.]MBL8579104.1 ABC transporter permease [Mesorhizobium sp.]